MYINSFVIFLTLGKHSYRSFRHSLSLVETGFFYCWQKRANKKENERSERRGIKSVENWMVALSKEEKKKKKKNELVISLKTGSHTRQIFRKSRATRSVGFQFSRRRVFAFRACAVSINLVHARVSHLQNRSFDDFIHEGRPVSLIFCNTIYRFVQLI